ncbi:hypothetical protein LJC08_05635 [Methanimicrococcus sp. OttesenSCG-928-J09]|nr:hypothetical protein [Methanimicrococcus sp. OttesenSCG-928-J09]
MSNQDELRNYLKPILEEKSSKDVFKNSMRELIPNCKTDDGKQHILLLFVSFTCSGIIFWFVSDLNKAIFSLIELSNSIILVLFATIFTVSALFISIINGRSLRYLLYPIDSKDQDYKSIYLAFTRQFYGLMLYFLIFIALNLILLFLMQNIQILYPIEFEIQIKVIFIILISVYFVLIVHALIETKCFIYNLYQIFKISVAGAVL